MKIIKPSVEIITPMDEKSISFALSHLEACGRVCYKSENNIKVNSATQFLKGIIKRKHEAVLEHYSVTVKFIVDRGVSHELVRHRLASYCQESTRYCNYSKDKFGNEITVIEPSFLPKGCYGYNLWSYSCECAENTYFRMLEWGCSPQEARSVLPNSLKTEVMMTANIREWRHFLKLRCDKAAHHQMREVATQLLEKFKEVLPALFEDIEVEE